MASTSLCRSAARLVWVGATALAFAPSLVIAQTDAPATDVQTEQPAPPPDRVVLENGDVLTGTLKSFADGKLVFESPVLGEVPIPLDRVQDLQTQATVTIVTTEDERITRRIVGMRDGQLQLVDPTDGAPTPELGLGQLGAINPPEKGVKWSGNATLGFAAATGNTERRSANVGVNIIRRSEFDRLSGDFSWSYAEENSGDGTGYQLTQRRTQGGAQYDYFVSDRLFTYANARGLADEFANIRLRFNSGAGLGYQWIENDTFNLLTEVGAAYVSEDFQTPGPVIDYLAANGRYRFIWNIMDGLQLDHGVRAFQSLESQEDLLINKVTNVNIALHEALFLQFTWELDYDNTPAPGATPTDPRAERVDQRFFLSVGYDF
jgi:putative salt-induced outer membrane protein YdiY